MGIKTERKFLTDAVPDDVEVLKKITIHQSYLATGEEEVRIRKSVVEGNTQYLLTIRKGRGITRNNFEMEISEDTYLQLLKGVKNRVLSKTRSKVPLGNNVVDVDVYHHLQFDNLIIIEIEFESEEEARAFIPPHWFGQEVTDDPSYTNQHLWENTY